MIHGDTRCTKRGFHRHVSVLKTYILKCEYGSLSLQGHFGAIEHNFDVKVLGIVVNYFSHSSRE